MNSWNSFLWFYNMRWKWCFSSGVRGEEIKFWYSSGFLKLACVLCQWQETEFNMVRKMTLWKVLCNCTLLIHIWKKKFLGKCHIFTDVFNNHTIFSLKFSVFLNLYRGNVGFSYYWKWSFIIVLIWSGLGDSDVFCINKNLG